MRAGRGKRSGVRHARLIAALCLIAPLPAAAQDADLEALTRAEAEARAEAERLAREGEAVSGEIADLKRSLTATTREAQAFEREAARLEAEVAEVASQIDALSARLTENRARTLDLLAALQRLELAPGAAAVTDPDDAVATAQAARLIDSLSSELQRRAASLSRLSEELIASRAELQTRRTELDANNRELLRRRTRVEALLKEKEALRLGIVKDASAAKAEVERLAKESADLRELLARLSEPVPDVAPSLKPARPDVSVPVARAPGTARFADAKGALLRPVVGALARRFGRGEPGDTYAAASEAQVVAPYGGRVEFAGPFKGYGRVVILNMDDGYFLLLTGLEQVYVETRESVVRGEPIGAMPTQAETRLYLELRHNGRTIDPAPWFG